MRAISSVQSKQPACRWAGSVASCGLGANDEVVAARTMAVTASRGRRVRRQRAQVAMAVDPWRWHLRGEGVERFLARHAPERCGDSDTRLENRNCSGFRYVVAIQATLAPAPTRKRHDKHAEPPIATANRRLTRPTGASTLNLVHVK